MRAHIDPDNKLVIVSESNEEALLLKMVRLKPNDPKVWALEYGDPYDPDRANIKTLMTFQIEPESINNER